MQPYKVFFESGAFAFIFAESAENAEAVANARQWGVVTEVEEVKE